MTLVAISSNARETLHDVRLSRCAAIRNLSTSRDTLWNETRLFFISALNSIKFLLRVRIAGRPGASLRRGRW